MTQAPFIGIGAEKSATSWIFACLYEHPGICIPKKELNSFLGNAPDRKGYFENFKSTIKDGQAWGEISTEYFHSETAAGLIHSIFPEAKLILSLRDPVDRAFSNYKNDLMAGQINKKLLFEEALKLRKDYVVKGKYQVQIERFFKYFRKDQLLILNYDDIHTDPQVFMKGIYNFIGVNQDFIPKYLNRRVNEGRGVNNLSVEKGMNSISKMLQSNGLARKLWWLVKSSGIPQNIRQQNTNAKPIAMKHETRIKLYKEFANDIAFVESILERSLNWSSEKNG